MAAGILGCGFQSAEKPQWNVVLVVVDTLRADHLQIYGYDRSTAPFLEDFSKKGLVFEQARSEAGCTFPSVNSLLTSKYPQRYLQTMREYGWGIPEYIPTLAEILRAGKYSTAAVSNSTIVRVNPSPPNPDGGFGAGFTEFDDSCMWNSAECVNEKAFGILDGLAEPFLMYLHYFDPHMPYQPPDTHKRVFASDVYEKPWVADGKLLPLNNMLFEEGDDVEFTDEDLAHAIDLYDEEIRYFDSQFSRLIEYLNTKQILERTVVVLTSDHGEEFLEHDHIFHCRDLTYDTIMKTPLLFWIPGLKRTGTTPALVQNLDIVPTILDYTGFDTSLYDLDGKSLRPIIEEDRSVHRYVFGMQRFARSVTDGRFKLIRNIKSGQVQLFDLKSDPTEKTDITARRPRLSEELEEVLMRWVDSVEGDIAAAGSVKKAGEVTERLRALGYL